MEQKPLHNVFDFSGKSVIVTGGAMGIGFGIVKRFKEAGAQVMIADINEEVGKAKAKEAGVGFHKTDVSDEHSVTTLIAETVHAFGTIDVLINNAGIFPSVPALEMTVDLWEKIQGINLRGVFLCSREAAKVMKSHGGAIVNIASIDALHPSQVGLAAYDASKHGVWGFTKNFALEVGKFNIRVNAIAPGGIATEGVANMNKDIPSSVDMQEVMKQFMAKIPMGRMGEPDDIAMPTLFLASDAARYMTGSIVVVDGGVLLS